MQNIGEAAAIEHGSEAAVETSPAALSQGPAPLIPGEKAETYEEVRRRMVATLKPTDFLEEMWAGEMAELVWEIQRLRRIKANLLSGCAQEGMERVLHSVGLDTPFSTSTGWAAREPRAMRRAEGALSASGFTLDTVMARTLSERISDIERIDRMTARAEHRRNVSLQQIRRHRAAFGEKLRHASESEMGAVERMVPERAPPLAAL
jgi:hypothetical protein